MDEPASKRRRVSPQNSSADAGSSNARPLSSEDARRRARFPSYASPTTASLSRFYPQILERRRSSSPSKSPSGRILPRPTSIAEADESISEPFNAPPIPAAEDAAASDLAEREDAPPRDTTAPSSSQGLPSMGEGLFAAPRRSPAKPNPRPLPPPAPEEDDEFNSYLGRRTRRSPNTGFPLSYPEPELPPSVPDAVSSTPPRGIHSSPSRWREKSKPRKNSPLKPLASRLQDAGAKSAIPMRGFLARQRTNDNSQERVLDEKTNPSRQVPLYDSNSEKMKEKEALLNDIAKLKKHLQIVNKENERIRVMQSSGRIVSSTDEDEVFDVVQQYLIESEELSLPSPSEQLMKAALNPMGLLPFGRLTSVVATAQDQDNTAGIKSHHPAQMTAEEELPYLQLFSPFSLSSTLAVLPQGPDESVRQRRLITFRSREPPGLFTAQVEMVINAMNLSILELQILTLEPPAKVELLPFLEKICSGDCNRSMQRNVGIVSWAMGEWYRVATQRARLWSQLDQEIVSKGGTLRIVEGIRRKRPQRSDDDSEEEPDASFCKKAELVRFMGEQSFELSIPPQGQSATASTVRLEWEIGFDWVGEAQSKVGVRIGVPGKWRDADERGVFGKLPGLFENLVEGGADPAAAVKTIVALVAGDRRAK